LAFWCSTWPHPSPFKAYIIIKQQFTCKRGDRDCDKEREQEDTTSRLEKATRDQSPKAGRVDGRNRSMREKDREIEVALGFWLEKMVKKLLSWSKNGGVLRWGA
jgi:hypothetical protein